MAFKKIRVLIVDDSLLFRQTLANELSKDFGIEIIGTAEDPWVLNKRGKTHYFCTNCDKDITKYVVNIKNNNNDTK